MVILESRNFINDRIKKKTSWIKMAISYNLKDTNLFKPLKVGDVTLKHRVALAPLTRCRNDDEFVPLDWTITNYDQRSKREGTLIITEAILVSLKSSGQYQPPGIFNEKQYPQWKRVIDVVHKNKSFIFLQIWALGGKADPAKLASKGMKFLAPSDDVYIHNDQKKLAQQSNNPAHGLTHDEVKEYIQDFVTAAKKSIELGADGVEIHGANGYLPFQFLYTSLNKRTDEYGGSIENRARFILELVDTIGETIGYSKVALRLSPYYSDFDNKLYEPSTIAVYSYLISELETRRLHGKEIAYLHIVEPRDETAGEVGEIVSDNEWILQIYRGVIVRASGYGNDHERTREHVQSYDKTVIAYGRHFIANPDLPNRLENDWPFNPYRRETFYVGGAEGYIDYPEYKNE